MKTFIYVDSQTLKANAEKNAYAPPVVVTGGGHNEPPRACHGVNIHGPCTIRYDKKGVVFAGHDAHVVVETEAEVELIGGW